MRSKFKKLIGRKTNTRTGGALDRALAIVANRGVREKPKSLAGVVKSIVKNSAETKMACWYNGPSPSDGSFGQAAYINQNSTITSNTTDILRLIPYVKQGTSDNQRIGEKIHPTSLQVKGSVCLLTNSINGPNNTVGVPTDIYVVIYVLQHVTLKSYDSLAAKNDFTQLLRTGENTTTNFAGHVWDSQMPVEDAYYRLLKKKKFRLRYAGAKQAMGGDPPNNQWVSVANAHSYRGEYSMNLSKYLPAQFKYPESGTAVGPNDPTNSSIFMCMGAYQGDGSVAQNWTYQQQYISNLSYKDL